MTNTTSPALLIDEGKCRSNIRRMAEKARRHSLTFKPHMKTHQSADIGQWFRDEGIQKATVSSIDMAEYFAEHGWEDITIAFPCNIREIKRINHLAGEVSLSLLVNRNDTAAYLDNQLTTSVNIYIEIDTGSGRTGFRADQKTSIEQQIETLSKMDNLHFTGFYSHPGHSYSARSKEEILRFHNDVRQQMNNLKSHFSSAEGPLKTCIGDTPCCSKGEHFEGIDEISPGNFAFYDLTQVQIGACNYSDIAVAMVCPVVDKYPGRQEIAIHGGAVHFSKDRLKTGDKVHFGIAVTLDNGTWSEPLKDCILTKISQEHGILSVNKQLFDKLSIGDLIGILPVHSCLTADLMSGYTTLEGTQLSHLRKR